jgi:hypothetical protein
VQGLGFYLVWQGTVHTAGERATAANGFGVVGCAAPVFPPGGERGVAEARFGGILFAEGLQEGVQRLHSGLTMLCAMLAGPAASGWSAWHAFIASTLICCRCRSVVVCCVVFATVLCRQRNAYH